MNSKDIKAIKHANSDIVKILSGGGVTVGGCEKIYRHRR